MATPQITYFHAPSEGADLAPNPSPSLAETLYTLPYSFSPALIAQLTSRSHTSDTLRLPYPEALTARKLAHSLASQAFYHPSAVAIGA